jgi:tetratricopeptide (TPR) repeat protein
VNTKVNVKLLLILVVSLLAAGTCVAVVHSVQVTRTAGEFIALADEAKEQGNDDKEVEYLRVYLGYRPDDIDAQARLALVRGRLALKSANGRAVMQAYLALDQVLRQDPSRLDVCEKAAELAILLRRFGGAGNPGEAEDHVQKLRTAAPDNAEYVYLEGRCEEAKAKDKTGYQSAAKLYERAIPRLKDRVEIYLRLATVREQIHEGDGAKVFDQLVADNPQLFQAHLNRALYKKGKADRLVRTAGPALGPKQKAGTEEKARVFLESAEADMAQARKLAPDDADVLLLAGQIASALKKNDAARDCLKRGIELHPKNIRFYQECARVELIDKKPEEALKVIRQALKQQVPAGQLWTMADFLIDVKELAEARKVIVLIGPDPNLGPLTDYLEGRALMVEEKWREAAKKLEAVSSLLLRSEQLKQQFGKLAYVWLGNCYAKMGRPDQELAAFRQAIKIDPLFTPARVGLASALAVSGRTDDAIEAYRGLSQARPESALNALRLLILRNVRSPKPDWTEVDKLIAKLPKEDKAKDEFILLNAEMKAAREDVSAARKLIEAEVKRQPKDARLRLALAGVERRAGDPKQELLRLQEAQREFGDTPGIRAALIQYWGRSSDQKAGERVEELGGNLAKFKEAEQTALRWALAEACFRRGDDKSMRHYLTELTQSPSQALQAHLALFDLALKAGNQDELGLELEAVRKVEGAGGVMGNYCQAAGLLAKARASAEPGPLLEQARVLVDRVGKQRPGWAQASVLEADLEEQAKNPEAAIRCYLRAIVDQGERQPALIRRAVYLLNNAQRFAEAQQVLRKLEEQDQGAMTGELGRVAAQLSLQNKDFKKAIALARKPVDADSKDFLDYIWLGEIQAAGDELDDAEKTLQKAVDRFSAVPDTWVALVRFQARHRSRAQAEATIKRASEKVSAPQLASTLGQCYELLNNLEEAAKHYKRDLALNPDSVRVLRRVADFYLRRGRPALAEAPLKRLLEPALKAPQDDVMWARRNLAIELGITGGYRQMSGARELVDQNLKLNPDSIEDQIAQAAIMTVYPDQRSEAIKTLERAFHRKTPTDKEQFLLARAYELNGQWPEARQRLFGLLASENPAPFFMEYFARALLSRNEPAEALIWIDRLEKQTQPALPIVELRARALYAQKKSDEAAKILLEHVKDKPDDSGKVAAILDQIRRATDAEPLYRKWLDTTKEPDAPLVVAEFLARQGNMSDAVSLWKKGTRGGAPIARTVAFGVAILRGSKCGPDFYQAVEEVLTEALRKDPRQVALLLNLAEIRDLQRKYPETIAAYREVLKLDPNNVVALNNLAWFLALAGNSASEALVLIDRAIGLVGPQPELLDTRAVIYLNMANPKEAIKNLEQAVKDRPTASRYFHLARAQKLADNRADAVTALETAQKNHGLRVESLHPLEQDQYAPLVAVLKQ